MRRSLLSLLRRQRKDGDIGGGTHSGGGVDILIGCGGHWLDRSYWLWLVLGLNWRSWLIVRR